MLSSNSFDAKLLYLKKGDVDEFICLNLF